MIDLTIDLHPADIQNGIRKVVPHVIDLFPAVCVRLSVCSEISPSAFVPAAVVDVLPCVCDHDAILIYIIGIIDQAVCLHHSIVIHIIPCIFGAYPVIPNEASVVVIVVIPFSILLRPARKGGRRHSCG